MHNAYDEAAEQEDDPPASSPQPAIESKEEKKTGLEAAGTSTQETALAPTTMTWTFKDTVPPQRATVPLSCFNAVRVQILGLHQVRSYVDDPPRSCLLDGALMETPRSAPTACDVMVTAMSTAEGELERLQRIDTDLVTLGDLRLCPLQYASFTCRGLLDGAATDFWIEIRQRLSGVTLWQYIQEQNYQPLETELSHLIINLFRRWESKGWLHLDLNAHTILVRRMRNGQDTRTELIAMSGMPARRRTPGDAGQHNSKATANAFVAQLKEQIQEIAMVLQYKRGVGMPPVKTSKARGLKWTIWSSSASLPVSCFDRRFIVINDQKQPIRAIGQGMFGTVFRARMKRTDPMVLGTSTAVNVAIKIVPLNTAIPSKTCLIQLSDRIAQPRKKCFSLSKEVFEHKTETVVARASDAKLGPHLYDWWTCVGKLDEKPVLYGITVTALVPGQNLDHYLKGGGKWTRGLRDAVLRELEKWDRPGGNGWTHPDLHPGNMMIYQPNRQVDQWEVNVIDMDDVRRSTERDILNKRSASRILPLLGAV